MVVALCAPQAHASKDVVLAIASTLTTTDPWDANDTLSHACAKTFYEGLFGFNEKLEHPESFGLGLRVAEPLMEHDRLRYLCPHGKHGVQGGHGLLKNH